MQPPRYQRCPRCDAQARYSDTRRGQLQLVRVIYMCGALFDLFLADAGLDTHKQLTRCPRDPLACQGEGI